MIHCFSNSVYLGNIRKLKTELNVADAVHCGTQKWLTEMVVTPFFKRHCCSLTCHPYIYCIYVLVLFIYSISIINRCIWWFGDTTVLLLP